MTPLRRKAGALFAVALLAALLTAGCARGPSGGTSPGAGARLILTMTVAGHIRPDYFYFVLFNTTNTPEKSPGPIPVVAAPWGNGFAAGEFTQFMRYDASQPNSGYGLYAVVPGSNLRGFTSLGAPVQFTPIGPGDNTLQFSVSLAQLATAAIPVSDINTVQVNFLATDRIPVDPNDPNPKQFDALGDARQPGGVNNPITISTVQSALYQNSDTNLEPAGDVMEAGNGTFVNVNNPDLDIVNWSIEVRN
jgi:hypothetical protein